MGKQIVSFITCESSAPFLYFTKLTQTHTALVIGLYELLGNSTAYLIEPPGPLFIYENKSFYFAMNIPERLLCYLAYDSGTFSFC